MKMELWIRSQDKERLIKPIDFYIEETIDYVNKCSEFDIYALNFANDDIRIGTYKTKERAIEVLDEIEKLIKPITIFQNCQVDKSTIEKIKGIGYCMVNDDARVEQISQAFYQMPEK